jgi:hypothetical protein
VAPLGRVKGAGAAKTDSYCLPGVVDAGGFAFRGARQAFQIDETAAAPLRGAGDADEGVSLHWACAEPMVLTSRQTAATMARPDDFQCDMSPPKICSGAEVRALNQADDMR